MSIKNILQIFYTKKLARSLAWPLPAPFAVVMSTRPGLARTGGTGATRPSRQCSPGGLSQRCCTGRNYY